MAAGGIPPKIRGDYVFTRSIAFTTIHTRADTIGAKIHRQRTSFVNLRAATRHSLLDVVLRDLGPALDEIKAMPLTNAEKKLLVRRLIESRLADVNNTHDQESANRSPRQS
jgi:hypothetical protein